MYKGKKVTYNVTGSTEGGVITMQPTYKGKYNEKSHSN